MDDVRSELGRRLRARRRAGGLTGVELARLIGISQAQVSKVETGQARIDEDLVTAWISHTSDAPDADGPAVTALAADTQQFTSWPALHARGWEEHQQRYEDLERAASRILTFQNALVPGLLQTSRYTHYLMREGLGLDDDQAALAVAARLDRQALLYQPGSRVDVILTEAVLRHRLGGPGVMAEQLRHLADLSSLPTVSLRVIPADTAMPSRYGVSFDLVESADGAGTVVVELEGGEFREDRAEQLARYRARFAVYERAALGAEASRAVVEELTARMRADLFPS
ncbi:MULTISPECIES: helix-turn-helix transcriptional regulator [unclassified Pseudonocardia]|uniref:helix-turn-helix domain-containing protein n=1 Tax=unclassified Pseudonocardia TaxID=2619320 RepID=UPI0001FFEB66|nr:helix-turn-helix transcriptional regulator [Pseudonocardia sp. Ae707_Ps1]OLM17434.1 putative DNA-binding protein in cluster with Type I restriction-modification system [Pseudonocardia sp. Ae707_Ps1]